MAPTQTKAHCNTCARSTAHYVRKTYEYTSDEPDTWFKERAEILQCSGCGLIGFRDTWWSSECIDPDQRPLEQKTSYPPATFRREPNWFSFLSTGNSAIVHLLAEVYVAMQNKALSLAAMGMRALIEVVMIDKVGDKGRFNDNMQAFLDGRHISQAQHDALEATLELGHASIHRSHNPTELQLTTALDITEHLIHGLYVLPEAAKGPLSEVPPKRPRQPRT